MDRYIGNIGLKAISGKDVNDFEGYRFEEGCYVVGGKEFRNTHVNPIEEAQRSTKRFMAIVAYFKWVKDAKPELYARFEPKRRMSRDAAGATQQ